MSSERTTRHIMTPSPSIAPQIPPYLLFLIHYARHAVHTESVKAQVLHQRREAIVVAHASSSVGIEVERVAGILDMQDRFPCSNKGGVVLAALVVFLALFIDGKMSDVQDLGDDDAFVGFARALAGQVTTRTSLPRSDAPLAPGPAPPARTRPRRAGLRPR